MTLEDIIRMAREAGWKDLRDFDSEMRDEIYTGNLQSLARFAALVDALVAAAEREACADLLDENAMACTSPIYRSLLQANAAAIRARGEDPMPLFSDWPGGFPSSKCPPCNQMCNQGRDCPASK